MAKRITKRNNRPAQQAAHFALPPDTPQISQDAELIRTRHALSGWPMVLGWLAMLIFTIYACTHMVAAGDTWVAMASGRHFVNHGVDTNEPFSANSHRQGPTQEEIDKTWPPWAQWITKKVGLETVKKWHPTGWVNQNWLTHVIFYLLVPKDSYADGVSFPSNALVYWKFAIYIVTVVCVFYCGVLLGVNPALSAVFSCFAMFMGRSFLDIRPAGFSNVLVAVFALVLVLATYRNILYIWLIVPLTVFWCNVHGGYIYVYIVMIPFIGLHFLNCLDKKWTAILYNVAAWPPYIWVVSKIGFKKLPEEQIYWMYFKLLLLFLFLVALDIVLVFFKKKLIRLKPRQVYHLIGAYVATILATIIFNPFHFTNLTHTFEISVSKHAERWRDIHEWHPAFEWSNPVGTAFPFLVMYILGIGLLGLWIFSRFFRPNYLKASKSQLQGQHRLAISLLKVFGYAATIILFWVVFVNLSFLSLDTLDFLFCALFALILLLSVHVNVHFIYLTVVLSLLAIWSGSPESGYSGRYIYPFVIIPGYVLVYGFFRLFSKTAPARHINVVFAVIPAIASLLLMIVLFNPFRFPHWYNVNRLWGLIPMWQPAYEVSTELVYPRLFSGLYIVNFTSIGLWLLVCETRSVFPRWPLEPGNEPSAEIYEFPRVDLAHIIIAVMTVYMAIRSRRFIPIAGIAACPVLALFVDQVLRAVAGLRNFVRHGRLTVPPMPKELQLAFVLAGAMAVAFFGSWWGLRFKAVYLDPWPNDPELASVFMRMTASDAKPFYATTFMKMNRLKGKMFNYWTEGGFIAWGQEPDPNTGHTPLQLFMDGRAQAAYNRRTFDLWTMIMSGGPTVNNATQKAKLLQKEIEEVLTVGDYKKIGAWVSEQLRGQNVWLVLMPAGQFGTPFTKGLEYISYDWPLVLLNNKEKIFVDVNSPQGKQLFYGVNTGQTLYPDDFHKNLVLGHTYLLQADLATRIKGFDFVKKAFEENRSPAPMLEMILIAARTQELIPQITEFCKSWVDDFQNNKDKYRAQNGYRLKLEAARLACIHLEKAAQARKDPRLADTYVARMRDYTVERDGISETKRW